MNDTLRNTKEDFNIFTILSKDDKELVHSSFIKFIFENSGIDFFNFFCESENAMNLQQEINTNTFVELEKKYSLINENKEKKNYRIDIQIVGKSKILIIENKFKSFPYKTQLEAYSDILKNEKDFKELTHIKYLLCFDKSFAPKVDGWYVKDYMELLDFIKINGKNVSGDRKVLINHYVKFLEDYNSKYDQYKIDVLSLFSDNPINKNFWMKLIYSGLGNKLMEKNVFERFELGSGSTREALIEFFPKKWYGEIRILLQLQGSKLKLYCHPDESIGSREYFNKIHNEISQYIKIDEEFKKYNTTFKNTTNLSKDGTYYLVYIDLLEYFKSRNKFQIADISKCIFDFYEEINNLLIKNKILK